MSNNKDKLFSVDAAAHERLGSVLVNGLKELEPGQCPPPEEIAALVDGRITGEKRDQLMKHLSSCDTCYEIFMLSADLQKETLIEVKKERSHIVIYRPLALAASVLIVVVAMYLFFKSDMPKTAEQLMEKSTSQVPESKSKAVPPQPQSVEPVETDFKDTDKAKEYSRPKAKKGSPATFGEDRSKAVSVEKSTEEISPRKDYFKESGKKANKARGTGFGIEKEEVPDEIHEKEKPRDKEERLGKKAEKPLAAPPESTPSKRMKVATQRIEQQTIGQQQEIRQTAPEKRVLKEGQAASAPTTSGLEKNMAWSQANILNIQSQQFRPHIPAKELRNMFKQSIDLTNQLKEPFEQVKNEVTRSGDKRKIDAFKQGLSPLIMIETGKDAIYIYPNIGYFLSKSKPGSLEYQFFSLARLGWCEPVGGCYNMEKSGELRALRTREKAETAAGKVGFSEDQLIQWKTLYPQLSGVFRDVASRTIVHLEDSQRGRIVPASKER